MSKIIIMFFQYFLFLGQKGMSKVCRVGTHWMQDFIPHLTSSSNRNLSKNTGRYVKNTSKKQFFSFLPPKLINIILLFQLLFYYFPQEAHFELKFPLINSEKIPCNQTAWMQAFTAPLYLAFAEENAMTACFLLDQKMGTPPNIKTYLEVEFQSMESLIQSKPV